MSQTKNIAARNIAARLQYAFTNHAESPAVLHGDAVLSYRDLDTRSTALARHLLRFSDGGHRNVGICLNRSCEQMVALLGVLKAGFAYVPFDPDYPPERLAYMAQASNIALMISSPSLATQLPQGNYPSLDISKIPQESESTALPDVTPENPAYILFTSGSTGQPKGVQMPHAALLNLIDWQVEQTTVHAGGRTLQFAPISFDVHFQEIFSTWADGGCLVLIDEDERLNPTHLLKRITEQRINRIYLPLIALHSLCEQARTYHGNLDSLQEIITAGEQLQITPAIVALFQSIPYCRLHNHYGPTETHVVTAYSLTGPPATWPALPPIGQAINNCQIYLLDDHGQPVAKGEIGEIHAAGDCLADGYVGRPDLTRERFIDNPFTPGTRMYRTGDLARHDANGQLIYLGRKDGQVKVRGYRIELGEVDVALSRLPQVRQAAAQVIGDTPDERQLVAYLVLQPEATLNASALRQQLQDKLPDYMLPGAFVQLDTLPRTPSGKVDRRQLPRPGNTRPDLDRPYRAPRNRNEQMLCALWSEILAIQPVGIDDNFFDLGGNSLKAQQCVSLLQARHQQSLPITQLYAKPTVAALAELFAASSERRKKIRRPRNQPENEQVDIAVIGMALRFPGAEDPESFWHNLAQGIESIRFFRPDELDPSLPADLIGNPDYVPARGILRDAEGFDAAFFGIHPNIALVTDPQQRIALELAWNALEHAGYGQPSEAQIGVFAGSGNNSYYRNNVLPHPEAINRVGEFMTMTRNEKDYIATHIAYSLNCRGPAISVHTACSTSLTAIILACQALRNGQCDLALAGGVSITAPIHSGQLHEEGAIYSADGHTRAFDAQATGTVFSDGGAFVVLKPLSQALADGDSIYAVVRGYALNNDGNDKGSFTAPSAEGQSDVVRRALTMADISPSSISYVETHGTATPIGDPIEIAGLSAVFAEATETGQNESYCAIGSVKTNIGHLTAAAGVAGFIKTVLALYQKKLPPSLFFSQANPHIDFSGSPFYVNTELRDWVSSTGPRRAGVSSFGVGGTNAHVVMEEAPCKAVTEPGSPAKAQLLLLSAKTASALDSRRQQLATHLKNHPETRLSDLAHTLHAGRQAMPYRCYAVVGSIEQGIAALTQTDTNLPIVSRHLQHAVDGVVFMFPGQGSQYVGMGSTLYPYEKPFRDAVDRCAAILHPWLEMDLRDILFATEGETAVRALQQTLNTQPALFVLGYALAQLWQSWGIKPCAMIGHSVGEFVAATLAGVFSLEDGLRLIATRARLMQAQAPGSMLSVRLPETEIAARLENEPTLAIAAVNGKQLCVIAGPDTDVARLQAQWELEGVICKPLHTSHAFHSPMMDPVIEPFLAVCREVSLQAPRCPILSTVTGDWLSDQQATDPTYWAGHLRATVRFAQGVRTLWEAEPDCLMLELGPRNTTTLLSRQQAPHPERQKAVPSLGDTALDDKERSVLLAAVGQLWLGGVDVDHRAFFGSTKHQRIGLPTYPFEHRPFWLPAPAARSPGQAFSSATAICQQDTAAQLTLQPQEVQIMPDRKQRLSEEILHLLEEASGMSLQGADPQASLIELGLDSLLLTQIALTLSQTYQSKVSFRQLNSELSSLQKLAEHFDRVLPPETASPKTATPTTVANNAQVSTPQHAPLPVSQTIMPAAATPGHEVQWLIAQQLQIMQQQLQALGGNRLAQPLPAQSLAMPALAPITNPVPVPADETSTQPKVFGAMARIEKIESRTTLTAEQRNWLNQFTQAYNDKTRASKAYTQQNRPHLADPRVVSGFHPLLKELTYQPVVNRSAGAQLWDIDGNTYVDVLNCFGANLFGHSPKFIVDAVSEQLQRGYELGPQHALAGEVAEAICELTGFDRAALCNTGSEAVMGAMRIARTVTGRKQIISFNNSYHGINDEVIVRGSRTNKPIPAAAGILPNAVQNMLVIDYGTPESLEIIREQAKLSAAVLVEPVQSRRADFQPVEFLREVREICTQNDCLLIFDEVITGFRAAPGGAQAVFGIRADVGTYGKIVGGGMPIGVIAGKREYMDALDGGHWQFGDDSVPEVGVTYFAGTFVRHPLALAAARASLKHMKDSGPRLQEGLNARTASLVEEINHFCRERSIPFSLVHFASLFKPRHDPSEPHMDLLYHLLRFKGVHIYDGFPCFLTEAHAPEDIQFVADSFKESLDELVNHGFISGSSHAKSQAKQRSPVTVTTNMAAPADHAMTSPPPLEAPSTEAQREVFTSVQIGGDAASAAYNESVTIRLFGPLESALLRQAFAQVLARHDALRICFDENGERFLVRNSIPLPWREILIPAAEDSHALLDKHEREETLRPFDLHQGPLVRATLLRLGTEEFGLIITAHHIVCDGWSLSLLIRDLSQCYSNLAGGHTARPPAAPSFAEYALSLDRYRNSAESRAVETYWLEQFSGELPVVEFPTDRTRPVTRTFHARRVDAPIPAEITARLRELGRQTSTSFVTLMLAAFETFLYRLTGQRDLVVGLPAAGQSIDGLYDLVGHCVHLLPLRAQIDPAQTFLAFLEYRREKLFDAYEHQKFTFGSLLQKLNIHRDPSRIPLVPIVFNVDVGFTEGFHFAECRFETRTNPRFFENFELFLNVAGENEQLILECTFNNELYDREMMRLRMDEFVYWLSQIVEQPDMPIQQLGLIPPVEQVRLDKANATTVNHEEPLGIHECIALAAKQQPRGKTAVVAGGRSMSYVELQEQANRYAHQLQTQGVKPGQFVGVCLLRDIQLPAILLGIMQCGAAYLPLDPDFPAERLHYMIDDAQPAIVLTTQSLQEKLGFPESSVRLLETLTSTTTPETPLQAPTVTTDALAYVLYTSGSTGKPKGISVRHAAVCNLLKDLGPNMGLDSSSHLLSVTTISFDISVLEIFLPLMRGATLHLASRGEAIDPDWLSNYIKREAIHFIQATPATYDMLLSSGWQGAPNLSVLCGGEGLRAELAEKLMSCCREVWNLYGPTETTIWSTAERITVDAPLRVRNGLCSIGRPVANTRVFITDEQGQCCPLGVPGELRIGGDGLSAGYLNRPELNAEKFVPAPDGNGLVFRTGDRVLIDKDGHLYYLSRFDHQIKIRGYRIEAGEVETALNDCPGIRQAVVMAVPDLTQGQNTLVAWYLPSGLEDEATLIDSSRRHLADKLPDYMIPSVWVALEKFPLTPNGKVDRKALPAPRKHSRLVFDKEPRKLNHMQQEILRLWQDVLPVQDIGLDDNFFDLGGHSLLAVKLMVELEKITGKKMPLAVLFTAGTIRELALMYEDTESDGLWKPLVTLNDRGNKPPIYFAHGVSGNIFKYHALAQYLPGNRPSYGLQALGLNGTDKPFRDMKTMAAYQIDAIRQIQPHGPYNLAGGSFGGYLAYEMALQLQAAGEKVGMLALCDIEACRKTDFLPPGARELLGAALFSTRFIKRAVELAMADSKQREAYFARREARFKGKEYDSWLDKYNMAEMIGHESTTAFKEIEEACYEALISYRIPNYDGNILLIRAQNSNFNNEYSYDLGWSNFVSGKIEVASVPGDHNSIFWEPNVADLAICMSDYLNKSRL